MTEEPAGQPIQLLPIGVVRCESKERADAPRQPRVAEDILGRVELYPGRHLEDAVCDLDAWDHIWLVVWFDRNVGIYHPKVQPPRSPQKRGVLATRAPYRPNPIGMSAVRLLAVDGLSLSIQGVDLLDGTPVLDIKPYVPYTDAIAGASSGWLAAAPDPGPAYEVGFSDHASEQLAWLLAEHGVDLSARLSQALSLGPTPHAYRRIRKLDDGFVIALKDWRAAFSIRGKQVAVTALFSGYRPRELFSPEGSAPAPHALFAARYGLSGNDCPSS